MSRGLLAPIVDELDRAADEGRAARVWWRDDDAVEATRALERLLALAEAVGAPLALAAIPALASPSLSERLSSADRVTVLVHGLAHANHAAPGDKRAEFGPHRPLSLVQADLRRALTATRAAFGERALPVFVPPWNRIAPAVAAALPSCGYRGLSSFASAERSATVPGCLRVDAHLDPVDWRGDRSLRSPAAVADAFRGALARPGEPIGLLTHHLMFDERLWSFTRDLVELFAEHPATRWTSLELLLEDGGRPSQPRLVPEQEGERHPARPEYAT